MEKNIEIPNQNDWSELNKFIKEHIENGVLIDGELLCLFFSKDFKNKNAIRVTIFENQGDGLHLRVHHTYEGENAIEKAIQKCSDELSLVTREGKANVTYVDDIGDWGERSVIEWCGPFFTPPPLPIHNLDEYE